MHGQVFLGAISGTSVDGLDLALIRVAGDIEVLAAATVPIPEALRATLLELGQPGPVDLDRLGDADAALGDFIGGAILRFLADHAHPADAVAAIGSHGQTVRHRPGAAHPFTMQVGDPSRIAEATGITTVADFRRRDMAAGGQGAPLVPPFHAALFRHPTEHRAVLNLGGIGNLTLLSAAGEVPISGFDTGPGNALLDAWIARHRQQPFDRDGAWAASGRVDEPLLARLLKEPYLAAEPPKSTGREQFNLAWLDAQLARHPGGSALAPADVQATLCAFTAESVARALATWGPATERVIVCGGGRLNPTLMTDLDGRLPCAVEPAEAHGVDGDSIEAAAFAWLAHQTLNGQPGNEPAVTGAAGPRVLGGVYRA